MGNGRRTRWEGNRRGFAHIVVVGLIGLGIFLASLAALSLIPAGGAAGYNVSVTVNYVEVPAFVATVYGVTGVSGSTTGSSPFINWGNSLNVQVFQVSSTYSAKTCVGNQCSTLYGNQWFSSIPVANGGSITASDTFSIGGVPPGHQTITTSLSSNGQVVATGSGTMCVNGNGC